MADADRIGLAFQEEVAFGVDPLGARQAVRLTAESLSKVTDTLQSTELRTDRQVTDLIRNGIRVSGGFDFELSYGAFDVMLAAVLFSADFPAAAVIAGASANLAYSIVKATGVLTDDGATGSFAAVVIGQWLLLGNWVNAANNVLVKVIAKADNNTLTIAGLLPLLDETRAANGVGANAQITIGSQIVNSTTQRSFTFVKNFTDLVKFAVMRGLTPEGATLNVAADAIVTGNFSFLGKDEDPIANADPGGVTTPAPTNPVMNAIDNVLGVVEGDPAVNVDNTFCVLSVSMTIANNLRERLCVGELGANSIGAGKFIVTGALQTYFEAQAMADKYLSFTDSAISMIFSDALGNRYVVDMPRVKFSQGTKVASGENTDIILDMTFTAIRDALDGITLRIVRFPAS